MSNIHKGSNVSPAAPMAGEISFQGEQATAASPAANYANPAEAAFANGAFNESTAPQADAASVVTIRKPGTLTILIVVAGVCVVALGVYLAWLLLGASRAADLAALDRAVHEAEAPHLNAGFVAESDLGSLLDDIEGVARSSGEVRSHDRYGEHVTMELVDGSLYMYAAPLSSMTGANGEVGLVSLEATANPPDTQSGSGSTQLASWVLRVASEGGIAPTSAGVLSGEQVSLDALRRLGSNQMVLYMGRGGYTTKGGPFFTTGTKLTDGLRAKYVEDLEAKRLGISSDGFFVVLPAFFEAYYGEGSLAGTNLILVSGGTMHDERLADVLVGRGASTVTGFTESVGLDYCRSIMEAMLGFDDNRGLLDAGTDGMRVTFLEAASNARAKAGKFDPTTKESSLWTGTAPAEWRCYPENAAMNVRLTTTPIDGQVVEVTAEEEPQQLQPTDDSSALVPVDPNAGIRSAYDSILEQYRQAVAQYKATEKGDVDLLYDYGIYEGSTFGYAFIDVDGNGVEELLITPEANNPNGSLLGMYTLINGQPYEILAGWPRSTYWLTGEKNRIGYHGSGGAATGVKMLYSLNGSELVEEEGYDWDVDSGWTYVTVNHTLKGSVVESDGYPYSGGTDPFDQEIRELASSDANISWTLF